MTQLGNYGNCKTNKLGTGVRACDITRFGDATGIVKFDKGWFKTIDATGNVDFDLASYLTDVKGLKITPLTDIYDFAQNTPENEKNTSSTGVKSKIRDGKPEFTFMFDKGSCFHKALYSHSGQGTADLGILFETGILMAKNIDETKLKGFDMGMFDVETFKLIQGTDRQSSNAMLQLLDAVEFNARHVFIPFNTAGDIGNVNGVVETAISVSPIVAGTEVRATITSSCNTGDTILGLDDASNFALLGTQASATTISDVSIDASTQEYVFTVSPALVATDTVQLKLNDGTYDVVEDDDANLYKGTSNTVTVSA